ncbi:unnamed protein product [Hermetia illucens]|uniref:G-protein coupled receptors family 3 profile domain-containing protein n=1 Tax=Hermetia illucens TaxID=343691 RepID=A0A7R8YP81_HERIL|nr:unnamed protein product [Hermetia illucens]
MARRPKRSASVLTSVCTIRVFRMIVICSFLIDAISCNDYNVLTVGTNLNFPVTSADGRPRYLNPYSDVPANGTSLLDKSDLDNDYNHHDHHLLNSNNIPSDVVIPVTGDVERFGDREQQHDRDSVRDSLMQQLRRNDDAYDGNYHHIDNGIGTNNGGNHSMLKADRLIEMSTEFFVIPSSTTEDEKSGLIRSSTVRPILILAARTPPTENESTASPAANASAQTGLRKEPWVVPLLVIACLAMILMTAFEIFVLFKAWRTSPSRRHLFLGQMLLLGLFACAGIGALLTATPTVVSCAIIRFGAGVAFALVFAALLVKCVFLISLNGGVYLPAPYQGLLLLFAVLIQVAIGTQWLVTEPPDIHTIRIGSHHATVTNKFSTLGLITSSDLTRISATIPLCKTQFSELLLSMIYIIFLIIFVAILAIKSRGIRDNYREATYIGLAIGGSIPIWLGWTLCGLIVADRHKDACLAFGLVATSATVFLVMFMPKGRQLAAMGKEGLYVEDREEQFSSLSRAGSGYSPSFFHFKPIKYGVMGGVLNSTTTTGNATKHQSAATLGGDRVALVAAPPPSYTRMYHYFPAHMTQPFCFYPPPPPPISPPPPPLKSLVAAIGGGLSTLQTQHHHQQSTQKQHQQQSQQQQQTATAQLAQTLRYPGLFIRPDEANLYTTLEPTLSSNPNVYFQRSGGVHPGMMY